LVKQLPAHPKHKGTIVMDRYMVDCRKTPSDSNCSLTIAGSADEVITAATAHAVSAHGHEDNTELREMIRQSLESAEQALA
jgi:predicted small metal-binding protein